MSACKRKRDHSPESSDEAGVSDTHFKRHRSQSIDGDTSGNGDATSPKFKPPPSLDELDRMSYHIELEEFAVKLQTAANLIFPGDQISRYSKVDVILLSWEDEDPHLPVSIEIKQLATILTCVYHFHVEEWLIPADDSHNKLQTKVLQFLDNSDPRHLKIVYYAGHGKLTNHGQPAWTSRRNSGQERCPTVKWSGIQNSLEESRSDVLILLDCCASGVCTTDEGNGVTELMAACAYNSIANGVGPFSFTHALNMKLRQLSHLPSFTIGYLYNAIFTEVQSWRFEDSRHKKAPIHLVLSQNHDHPRSIRLSNPSTYRKRPNPSSNPQVYPFSASESQHAQSQGYPSTQASSSHSSVPESSFPFTQSPSPSSSATSLSQLQEYPRLLFSIRISEDVKPSELSTELFTDWLRDVPMSSSLVKVEAAFASDSTLLMVSMPAAMWAYIPPSPSITFLGTTRSRNLLPDSVPELKHAEKFRRTTQSESETEPEDYLPTETTPASHQPTIARKAEENRERQSLNFRNRRTDLGRPQKAGGELSSPPASPGPSSPRNLTEGSRKKPIKSRMACQMCRLKKQICDEEHPQCGSCKQTNLTCSYRKPEVTKKDKRLLETLESKLDRAISDLGKAEKTNDRITDATDASDLAALPPDGIPLDSTFFSENSSLLTPLPSMDRLSSLANTSEKDKTLDSVPLGHPMMRSSSARSYASNKVQTAEHSKEARSNPNPAKESSSDPSSSAPITFDGVEAVQCPTCAANGQERWVPWTVSDGICPFCGTVWSDT